MNHTISRVAAYPLNANLARPFNIAGGGLETVRNVAICVEFSGGIAGWGECAVLRPTTKLGQSEILALSAKIQSLLLGVPGDDWRVPCANAHRALSQWPAVSAAVQMAICDAYAQGTGQPLFHLFGGKTQALETDITIPICGAAEAHDLARQYRRDGFKTIKTKIGIKIAEDLERIKEIRRGFPECKLLLDANEGFDAEQALSLLGTLKEQGIEPVLFEQPVQRADWAGLGQVTRGSEVPIAADESCRSPLDARRIIDEGLADVINIKLAKVGVLGALEIVALAQENDIGLMIGAMVETRLGCGFAAHLVAGCGGFDFIDLDTALLMSDDPIVGGYALDGPRIQLDPDTDGHGMSLR